MMHEPKKSDPPERRSRRTKPSCHRTQIRARVSQALGRVRQKASLASFTGATARNQPKPGRFHTQSIDFAAAFDILALHEDGVARY